MRTSRFLYATRKKILGNHHSPSRMPDSTACVLPTPFVHRSVPVRTNIIASSDRFSATCSKETIVEMARKFNAICVKPKRSFNKGPDLPNAPDMNVFHFKKFLRTKGLEYEESHSCLSLNIPKHILDDTLGEAAAPEDISTPSVFINKKTGNFVIPGCGVTGSWSEFESLIITWLKNRNLKRTDSKLTYPVLCSIESNLPHKLSSYYRELTSVGDLSDSDFKHLLKNLKLLRRDFEIKDFVQLEARVNADLNEVLFPVRYTSGNVVGYRKIFIENSDVSEVNVPFSANSALLPFPHGLYEAGSSSNSSSSSCSSNSSSNSGSSSSSSSSCSSSSSSSSCSSSTSSSSGSSNSSNSSCIIVGSILDSLALISRTRIPVITLPDWSNLHPDHLPFLLHFHTIYLWLSNDIHGSQNSKVFSQKIEDKKCRIVSCQYPTPLEAVRLRMNVKEILESSRSNYHEYLTTFENLRDNVYLEFLQAEELMGVKWKRYEPLNSILGGFRRGELTIFSGRTGSGKTTFLSEYSLDLCVQGVNTLWCSFEVKNVRLLKMMLKQFSLINIDENLSEFEEVADRFSRIPLYLTDFHGSQHVARVQEAMSHAVYVHDITHIIVDNMQFMLGSSGTSDKFQLQDNTITMFRKFATSHNCHVTLVIHPRKEDEELLTSNSIFGGAKATQEADNVLLLQEEATPHSFFKKKSVQVVKNRYAGDLGKVPLVFTKPILTFSKKIADEFKRHVKRKPVAFLSGDDGEISKVINPDDDDEVH